MDDALTISRCAKDYKLDRFRKDLTSTINLFGLKVTMETNLKSVDFLNVTLDLESGTY